MTAITLHRASRIELAIEKALKLYEPKVTSKVSIFADNPEAEIASKHAEFEKNFDHVRELMRILSRIRAVVGVKNAQVGISDILANQKYYNNLLTLLAKVPGVVPRATEEPEDEYGFRRRKRKAPVPEVLDRAAVVKMIQASRARFESAEQAPVDEVEVSCVGAEDVPRYKRFEVEARRALDEISDGLRVLNSSERVEVSDADVDWLTTHGVI